MKTGIILVFLALLGAWDGLKVIHDRNEAIQKAQAAYTRSDFVTAAALYKQAVEKLGATDEMVLLNYGHATIQAKQLAVARAAYGRLLISRQPLLRSTAGQQLAVLAAGKGEYAQALQLLKQALLANPTNTIARHNYELISEYLRRRRTNPNIPPPTTADAAPTPAGQPTNQPSPSSQPPPKLGKDQQGQLDDPTQPNNSRNQSSSRQAENGQRDPSRPSGKPGSTANGSFKPGLGPERNVAQGANPGSELGLSDSNTGPEARSGISNRPGTEAATLDEVQLQTQRARLQQMNLSSGRARQLLEALSAAERQYLQQLPRSSTRKPESNKPMW